ncbi:MAG: hypothetical protein KA436_11885 [Oligoflexales bacterium]|nr:hypothetical protein [Oligoflexales bacterium]
MRRMAYRFFVLMLLVSTQAVADPEREFEYIADLAFRVKELESKVALQVLKSEKRRDLAQTAVEQTLAMKSSDLSLEMQYHLRLAQSRLGILHADFRRFEEATRLFESHVQALKSIFRDATAAISTIRSLQYDLESRLETGETTQQEFNQAVVALHDVSDKVFHTFGATSAFTASATVSREEENIIRSLDMILSHLHPFYTPGTEPRVLADGPWIPGKALK